MKIYLCEDDPVQLTYYTQLIEKGCRTLHGQPISVSSFQQPQLLLDELSHHDSQTEKRLFFLDIHLTSEMSGIDTAQIIRETDKDSDIVFLTTDIQQMPLTYHSQVRALDFLLKTDQKSLTEGIERCIKNAASAISSKKMIHIQNRSGIQQIPLDDLMFFCTNGKRTTLEMHTTNSCVEFKASLKNLANKHPELLFVHQGFLVNPDNIKQYYSKKRILEMINGEFCEVAIRSHKQVLAVLEK